ncbi:MAG: LPS export ABC transporter periplasmic protein LptC [Reichenbachiella sp.]
MKQVYLLLTSLSLMFLSCKSDTKMLSQETYEGPAVTMDNIDVLISDSTIIKLRLVAAKQLVLSNKDRDFPEGIYLEFYNVEGFMTSTLKANTGYYYSKEDYYTAAGNVIMESKTSKNELTTELLNWVPKEERIHTDNFVTIVTDDEVLTGEGLEATQDFEEYTILKPSGTMKVSGSNQPIQADDGFDEDLEFVEDTTQYE